MDREKWTETMLEFYEREGYYPDFAKPESWRKKEEQEREQAPRPRLVLRKRKHWK